MRISDWSSDVCSSDLDPDAPHPDALDAGSDWARGFLRAVDLREEAWDAWLDEDEWIAAILGLLDKIASGAVLGEAPADPHASLSWSQRVEHLLRLPGTLPSMQPPHYPPTTHPKP